MESGRGGGGAWQRGAERRGFWVSLRGKDRGAVVQEGIDFAQDSDEVVAVTTSLFLIQRMKSVMRALSSLKPRSRRPPWISL